MIEHSYITDDMQSFIFSAIIQAVDKGTRKGQSRKGIAKKKTLRALCVFAFACAFLVSACPIYVRVSCWLFPDPFQKASETF